MRIFIVIFLAVVFGGNYYVFVRLWQMIPAGGTGRILLLAGAATVVSAFLLYVFISIGALSLPSAATVAIYRIATSWLIIMVYLILVFLAADLLRLTGLRLGGVMHGNGLSFWVLAGTMTTLMTYGYIRYLNKERIELDITTEKDFGETHPLKIVVLSDLHLGHGIGAKELRKWITLVNAENPDVVLIAGDLIDTDTRFLKERDILNTLGGIESKYGVYLALGNHEYIAGAAQHPAFLDGTGITVLKDSTVLVGGSFYIVGRDDRSNPRRKSLKELTNGLDRSKPVIMLDHQPYRLEEAAENGIDLQVSGHTHRGQIWPISLITDRMFENSHGYLKKGGSHIFVSQGIGVWGGKFRIGTRSDYAVINLSAGNSGRTE